MSVEVTIPDESQILALFEPMVEILQQVAKDEFWLIVKDHAMLDNEDVDGQQMPPKQPRPKKNPQNFPNLPLIQDTEPDLMSNERFTEIMTDDGADMIYYPPDHLQWLLEKPQTERGGGRHWITADGRINPNARADIEARIAEKINDHINP